MMREPYEGMWNEKRKKDIMNSGKIHSNKHLIYSALGNDKIKVYLEGHEKSSENYQWYDVPKMNVLSGKTSNNERVYLYLYDDFEVASIKFRGEEIEFDREGNAYSDSWYAEVDVDDKDDGSVNLSLRLFE